MQGLLCEKAAANIYVKTLLSCHYSHADLESDSKQNILTSFPLTAKTILTACHNSH